MPSLVEVQKTLAWSEIRPFLFLTHRFTLEQRLFKALFPHYRRTSPATISRFRIIHRFDRANSVGAIVKSGV